MHPAGGVQPPVNADISEWGGDHPGSPGQVKALRGNPDPGETGRCRYLAEGLAARTAQPVENFMWMDYGQLEALTALGTAAGITGGARQFIDNAAIIPRLFRENPVAALQALEQFGCQNRETIQGFTATAVIATAQLAFQSGVFGSGSAAFGLGSAGSGFSAGGIGIIFAGGVILAVGGLILWDDLTRQQPGSNILESLITPRSDRDWGHLSRSLHIDRKELSNNLHDCKFNAGVPPDGNVQVDDETGDIYYRGEYIGNIIDGC